MTAARLSLHDGVLVNAMTALVVPVVDVPSRQRMHLTTIRDHLRFVSRAHPRVAALAGIAENILLCHPTIANRSTGLSWSAVSWDARQALADFAEWRLGETLHELELRTGGK